MGRFWGCFLSVWLGAAGMVFSAQAEERQLRADPVAAPYLLRLIDERKLKGLPEKDQELALLRTVATPAGYRLRYRLENLGVPVAQALVLSRHEQLKGRLLEAARWAHSPRAREQALLGLAVFRNPEHLKFFREALLDKDLSIQFAAIDALQVYGGDEAGAMVENVAEKSWSALSRLYAAQASCRMGRPRGCDALRRLLRDPNDLVRAMSARYIGELGGAADADLLTARLGPEQGKPFVLAELCTSALRLMAKKQPSSPPPAAPVRSALGPAPAALNVFQMEPLIIKAPRVLTQLMDVRIDNSLINLLEKIAQEPPSEEQITDPVYRELTGVYTPVGFGLRVRYRDLGIALVEGLSGTSNLTLIRRLETFAAQDENRLVRAVALIALGNEPRRRDLSPFERALRDPKLIVRFSAVEGLAALGAPEARSLLAAAAQGDESRILRVYAAQSLWRAGDPHAAEAVRRALSDPSWIVRAMAVSVLGEFGDESDYNQIMFRLRGETNDNVIAESALALLRLGGGS